MGKKPFITIQQTLVDKKSGEVFDIHNVQSFRIPDEPRFTKSYKNGGMEALKILSGNELKCFLFISWVVDEANEAFIDYRLRSNMGNLIGLSERHIRNILTQLVKKGVLFRTDRKSIYQLNVEFLAVGRWATIQAQQIIQQSYHSDGRRLRVTRISERTIEFEEFR